MENVSAACAMEWSIKLEKALRSKNPVRAVEAILETGEKLEQWSKEPEPAIAVYNFFGLIPEEDRLFYNTILLRLVDAFCVEDKLVKVAVVRVFMSMFKLSRGKNKFECPTWFLSKDRVHNHLEMLKIVKNVYDKGDTEAKALALILFGCWRDFASGFAPVRFLIFTSMVSSHDLEVRSSLFSAACFCEVADDFALVVLRMLHDMVKFPELMPKTRLAAVRVFAKMGCSHAIADRAFKICMKLMLESSDEDTSVPFLVSLTKLASRSTHLASELSEVILPFLGEDKTSRVRAAVLRCLHFLIKRGMCFSLVQESEMAIFSSLLKQEELSPDMQLKALQIFHKILVYKLGVADASELHQLIAIVENASHLQIFSGGCLSIRILVDIWKQIVRIAEVRSIEVSSTSLSLQLVVLIMDRVTLLGRLCSDPFQVDYALVGEVQDLFNVLHLLVEKHSEVRMLVLEKVRLFLDYIVNLTDGLRKSDGAHELLLGVISYKGKRGSVVRSELLASIHKFMIVFLENLEGDGSVLSQVYEKVKCITDCVRSCSFFDCHTQMKFTLLLHSPSLWGFFMNEIGTSNDTDGNPGVSHVADIFKYEIVSLECSTQMLAERNYWPAYRAGVYAARLGAWVTSALIFDKLKNNFQSDITCSWLKSLTYLSHAEGKFQLLLMPSESFKLVNWLRSNGYLPELSKAASGEFVHCVALHEAYMNLQSSLGMLGNIATSSVVFCFQTWFLVLKTRVLETVIDLVECLGLLNQDTCNKKQVEEKILTGCNSLKQLPRISIKLQKLAREFDMLASCFVDIDDSSSSIIATLSLSCSVLAFTAGVVLFLPEVILPFLGEDKTSHVRAAVIRCLHFLIKRGMCFSLVQESEMAIFSSLLKQEELSPDMQLKALQIFHKILVYKLGMADASELHQLIAIVESASHLQIFSGGCLSISILVDIWKQIVRTAEIRSIEVSSTSLPLQLVVLIMDRVTLLGRLCSDPFQVDYALVTEVQDLFNVLQLLVEKHSEVRMLVLEKVRLFLDYFVNLTDGLRKSDGTHEQLLGVINYKGQRGSVMKSELLVSIHKFMIVFLENLEGDGSVLSQVYEKVKYITDCVRSRSFFDCHTQMNFTLLLHSPILWGSSMNDGNSGVSLVADICKYGIVSLECSTQMLTERNYWPAYRAGVYAARLGAWVTSALIFDKLKTNVQSDITCFWLKSLTYLSHAEGKFQLLLMPSDSFKLVNWLRSSGYLPELSKDAAGEFAHCVTLHEAYMNLQSSLGMLGNITATNVLFCFQTWFLVLKTRVLETVIDVVECFGLLNQDTCNKKQVEEKILTGCNSLQQLPRISIKLQKLAKEFDMLATCFVDIDDSSSSNIATLSLSCSVLSFAAAGIVLFFPGFSFHETLVPFTSQGTVCSRLVQYLVQRLWTVDPEICEKLSILVKENKSLNCFHLQPRNQVLRVCGKVEKLLSICRDVLSCIYGLQNRSDSMHDEERLSEITKSCRNLLSQAIMKWMQIPFGIPKYFFNIRPCVGAELFARSSDSSKTTPDTISVEQGFQLSLDLCLQLKNIQQLKVPVRLTKLYCLLYTKLAFHTPTQHGETKRNQKAYSPWRDEDLVEMSNKLFHYAITKSSTTPAVSGRFDWNNNGVSTVVQFEPNERGQGFSSCLLDISCFPVGSFQIKWLSCCVDQHGSHWNLLPLNGKPVFTVEKTS